MFFIRTKLWPGYRRADVRCCARDWIWKLGWDPVGSSAPLCELDLVVGLLFIWLLVVWTGLGFPMVQSFLVKFIVGFKVPTQRFGGICHFSNSILHIVLSFLKSQRETCKRPHPLKGSRSLRLKHSKSLFSWGLVSKDRKRRQGISVDREATTYQESCWGGNWGRRDLSVPRVTGVGAICLQTRSGTDDRTTRCSQPPARQSKGPQGGDAGQLFDHIYRQLVVDWKYLKRHVPSPGNGNDAFPSNEVCLVSDQRRRALILVIPCPSLASQ